jgi:hypothetical protein
MTDNPDPDDPTWANDQGGPGDTLSPMESTDPDDVRNRDGDEVVDPPENWSECNKYGLTPREAREGEPIDYKLGAEEPDPAGRPLDDDQDDEDSEDDRDTPPDRAEPEPDDVIEHIYPEDNGEHHGQVDGTPEDGEPIFTVVD